VRFQDLRDLGDPAEHARLYDEQGADEIVFLDITAAPEHRDTRLDWVERVAEQVFIPLSVGGGVRRVEDAERLLRAGADKVAVNSAAVDRPELLDELARRFGSQCVVLSVDARRRPSPPGPWRPSPPGPLSPGARGRRIRNEDQSSDLAPSWEVVTHGGRQARGLDAIRWIEAGVERGAGEILLTSIDSDGTRAGYDLDLLRAAASRVRVPVIASGGAGRLEHLAEALAAGAAAVLAASIFHEHKVTVGEVKRFLAARGFAMREVA